MVASSWCRVDRGTGVVVSPLGFSSFLSGEEQHVCLGIRSQHCTLCKTIYASEMKSQICNVDFFPSVAYWNSSLMASHVYL